MELKDLSSNWKKLQSKIGQQKPGPQSAPSKPQRSQKPQVAGVKRKKSFHETNNATSKRSKNGKSLRMGQTTSTEDEQISTEDAKSIAASISRKSLDSASASRPLVVTDRENEGLAADVEVGKYVAIDCEMVGVGPDPDKDSALARVSAVNFNGDQVYDSYVRPKEQVTDWRTHVSGIQPKHMVHARSFQEVQQDVAKLLDGRVLVGHAINNDLRALLLSHSKRDIRDTAKHQPFRRYAGGGTPKLKILASELLGIKIQSGEHSSVEDARASMLIFRREKDAFEKEHMKNWRAQPEPQRQLLTDNSKPKKKKKNKKSKRT